MEQRFHILTRVIFRHTYFADNICRTFTVRPDAATLHQLSRLSLVFRQQVDGFTLLYETSEQTGNSREEVLSQGLTLGFAVTNADTNLVNYTDGLPDNISDAVIYMRNEGITGDHLHAGAFVSTEDIIYNKVADQLSSNNRLFFNKPFGWIDLALKKDLQEIYYVDFKAKETVWRYILSSEHLGELSQPAILHRDTREVFKGPEWITLPDGKKRMAFESNTRMPLSNKPGKFFQLVENYDAESGRYKVVVGILPNPNVNLISALQKNNPGNPDFFSEIFI